MNMTATKKPLISRSMGFLFERQPACFSTKNYIEEADPGHSDDEQRYNVIGDTSAGNILQTHVEHSYATIGKIDRFAGDVNDILYVVYTERTRKEESGKVLDIIRIISARLANSFERGLYFGQYL